ncbi:MAG TPA: protein kinase [Candidatus Cryosericum sp.]|nr:protein kinase [Candidatus Cryosericum sp.]
MTGRTLGHYRVLERVGAGGMGEVYAADDLRLHRKVALKVLPPALSADLARRARFEREATAVAALSHPNIVVVHSVEEVDGVAFMTMELVEGRPLSAIIPPGGLPLGRFFDLAVPLADAVAAAHRAGVVHRDLKPDNVMVGPDGRLKVLDFGLAKLREAEAPATGSESALPTRHLTGQGQVVGTVAYMSPEQVEGKEVDQRTDLFSLGIVLYEMATGKRPFQGDSPASLVSSILRDAPSPASLVNSALPRHLGRIIRQCLAKSPDERTESARDVRNQLIDLKREIDSGALTPPGKGVPGADGEAAGVAAGGLRSWWKPALAGAAVMGLVAIGAMALLDRRSARPGAVSGSAGGATALATTLLKLTDVPGEEITPSLSPDGKFVAYASRATGNMDIYVLRVGGSNPVNLTSASTVNDTEPAFSPDGSKIAFRSERDGGGIFVMGATGESVVRVHTGGYRPAWSPDGARLVVGTGDFNVPSARPSRSQLWVVEVASGKAAKIFDGDAVQPAWSPSGGRIAYWGIPPASGQRDVWTIPAGGGTPVAVTQDASIDWNPAWAPDGRHLYFSSERGGSMNLWRVAIDEATGATHGDPEAVTIGVGAEIHSASLSGDGRHLVAVGSVLFQSLRRASLDLAHLRVAVDPVVLQRSSNPMLWVDASPDGRSVVYSTVAAGGRPGLTREEIVVSAVDGSFRRSVAASDSRNRIPRWSPKGDRISFASDRDGAYRIYTVRPDGSDLQHLEGARENSIYNAWSPAGDRLITMSASTHLSPVIVPWPPSGKGAEEVAPFPEEIENFVPTDWSPDGTVVAGHNQGQSGDVPGGIWLYHLASRTYERLTETGSYPRWLAGSRRLLYATDDAHAFYTVDRETRQVGRVPIALPGTFDAFSVTVSRDGSALYVAERLLEADLWMLDLADAKADGATAERR